MARSTKVLLVVSFCSLFSALFLLANYNSVGSYVDESGVLIEEFWALGLGLFGLIIGIFGLLSLSVIWVVSKIRKRKGTKR